MKSRRSTRGIHVLFLLYVCVCLCVCVLCVYMYMYTCTHTHTHVLACVCVYIHAYILTYINVFLPSVDVSSLSRVVAFFFKVVEPWKVQYGGTTFPPYYCYSKGAKRKIIKEAAALVGVALEFEIGVRKMPPWRPHSPHISSGHIVRISPGRMPYKISTIPCTHWDDSNEFHENLCKGVHL